MSGNGKRGKYDKPLHLSMPFSEALDRFAQTNPEEVGDAPAEKSGGPVSLIEDGDTGARFLVYEGKGGVQVELQVEGDTFWATQRQMADAFGVTPQNITIHLQNIYKEGELSEESTCKESLHVGRDGKPRPTKLYDLNALISVGYRVGGTAGTQFRIWATDKLLRYMNKGFVVDAERLKEPGNQDRIAELKETIRDIRSVEANVYAELQRICAMCQDYDGSSKEAHDFYARMQAKLYWAVVSHTPSEVLKERANALTENMGLRTWKGSNITQADAVVAKNYLGVAELRDLNRLTIILLDIFEDQVDQRKLVLMSQATALLDAQLRTLSRAVLTRGGRVSHADAETHAKAEYRKFDDQRRLERQERTLRELAELKATGNALPKVAGGVKGKRK